MRKSVDLHTGNTNSHSCTFPLTSKRSIRHPSTTGPEFDCNSSYFLAISCHPFTVGPCVLAVTLPKSSSAGGHGTASQRCTDIIHSPHTGQRKTARSQVFRFFLFLPLICKYLCFSATTSRLVSYDHRTFT